MVENSSRITYKTQKNTLNILSVTLTFLLVIGFLYNTFYNSFILQIEILGLLGFWLAFPLALAVIVISIVSLIDKRGSTFLYTLLLLISIIILGLDLYNLIFINKP